MHDLDDDGDPDLLVGNMDDFPTLLENRQQTGNKWVAFRVVSPTANRFAIGAKVTLRGDRMWEFFDRLVTLSIPRIRDFRGLNPRSFDGMGNYTFGLSEQLMFPEIDYDTVDAPRGMDITIVTTATSDAAGRALLNAFGFPFRRDGQAQ